MGTEYKVFVYYDRCRGLPESVLKYAGKSDAIDYTEVECALPVSRINCNGSGNDGLPLFDKLHKYYTWYKIPKSHIKFSLDMLYDIRHIKEEDDQQLLFTTNHQKFRYLDSVWRSTFSEFRDYINGITDKSITIQEALATVREVTCLPKKYYLISEGNKITIQDIAYNNTQIAELFDALRKGMQPESPNLPFKIKDKEKQLLEQLAKYKKGKIDLENAHTKIAIGHFPPPLNTGEKA